MRGQRDEDGFDEFVRVRAAALARVAYLLTGDRHHAEDLVQTALARAAVRWTRLDDPEAYVRRVLYTQAVSWWRVDSSQAAAPASRPSTSSPCKAAGSSPTADSSLVRPSTQSHIGIRAIQFDAA